ncbi:MAG: DUF6521 family protein [Candidatus Didemnitutus sp.]|jgi:hypothetical protein|nr:DUF6521 family protein [Candidatus Didemnitutus sp.]
MSLATEADLVQNPALGAALLHTFTLEYCEQNRNKSGPPITHLLPVLPMLLHEETVQELYRRHYEGGLLLALSENRTLTIGLQERMQSTVPRTMRALNLALAAGLLTYDPVEDQVRVAAKTRAEFSSGAETKPMHAAATRLGYWFATVRIEQLCSYLRIKF